MIRAAGRSTERRWAMSETLSLAFAFAWLFAVPAAPSQEVATDLLIKSEPQLQENAEQLRRRADRPAREKKPAGLAPENLLPGRA